MFGVGDSIVYGTDGVFVVSSYIDSPIDKNDTRVFYLLKPVYGPDGNVICAPSVGGSVHMRTIISKEEAEVFIDTIPEIKEIFVEKEKYRRDCYRNAMAEGHAKEYVSIIKTVCRRRSEFLKTKRRLSEADTEYENRAKFCLYGELSVALGKSFSEVERLVTEKLI